MAPGFGWDEGWSGGCGIGRGDDDGSFGGGLEGGGGFEWLGHGRSEARALCGLEVEVYAVDAVLSMLVDSYAESIRREKSGRSLQV